MTDFTSIGQQLDEGVAKLGEGVAKLEGSLAHSARGIEDDLDKDDDGSLLDDIGKDLIGEIPVVGDQLGSVGEELGDMATDVLGTRHAGVFSEKGTFDEETEDPDYQPDSEFQNQGGGFGQWINETAGIGEHAPHDYLPEDGGFVVPGGVEQDLRHVDDPMVAGDQSHDYYDYDNGGADE